MPNNKIATSVKKKHEADKVMRAPTQNEYSKIKLKQIIQNLHKSNADQTALLAKK